jgi:MFS family permease
MWVAYFLNYSDRQAVFAMFPVLRDDLGVSDRVLGFTGAIFLWCYGIGCPLAGALADRISKKLLVIASLIIWSIVTVAMGFTNGALMLLGLRAAMGFAESLYMPAAIALTANAHAPQRRSRAIAALTTAQIFGTIGGSWFGGWMAQQGMWRTAFWVLGAVGILYAIPYMLFLKGIPENLATGGDKSTAPASETVTQEKENEAASVIAAPPLYRIPTFWFLSWVFPLFVFGLWMLYSWLPSFLHDKFELSLTDAALQSTIYLQGMTLIGLLSGGVFADQLYRRTPAARLWLMTISLVGCAPALYCIGAGSTVGQVTFASAVYGIFSGFFMGNIFPACFEVVVVRRRATAVGMLNFFGAIVSGFAPWLGGELRKSIGIETLLAGTAAIYLTGAILLLICIQFFFHHDHMRVNIK